MRYIVLSFDDGLLDFKENALPILEKFNYKATISIITGFSDKTIKTEFNYLDITNIQNLVKKGFEVSVHSNSHTRSPSDIQDFEDCYKKLSSWTGLTQFGCVVPFIANIPNELMQYCKNNNYLYLSDWRDKPIHLSFIGTLYRFLNKIFRNNASFHCVFECFRVSYKPSFNKDDLPRIDRLTASRNNNSKNIKKFLKIMKNETCLTIMFHSILRNINDKCDWPKAAWTIQEFNDFMSYLSRHSKKFKVITQKEIVKYEC